MPPETMQSVGSQSHLVPGRVTSKDVRRPVEKQLGGQQGMPSMQQMMGAFMAMANAMAGSGSASSGANPLENLVFNNGRRTQPNAHRQKALANGLAGGSGTPKGSPRASPVEEDNSQNNSQNDTPRDEDEKQSDLFDLPKRTAPALPPKEQLQLMDASHGAREEAKKKEAEVEEKAKAKPKAKAKEKAKAKAVPRKTKAPTEVPDGDGGSPCPKAKAAASTKKQKVDPAEGVPAKVPRPDGRPNTPKAGDPACYYLEGKVLRNEKVWRCFLKRPYRSDRQVKIGDDADASFARCCEAIEKGHWS